VDLIGPFAGVPHPESKFAINTNREAVAATEPQFRYLRVSLKSGSELHLCRYSDLPYAWRRLHSMGGFSYFG
jgi:hypothetical protein